MATDELDFTLRSLVSHAVDTMRHPQQGARRVIGLDLPMQALWLSLALVVCISVLFGQATLMMSPQAMEMPNAYLANPVVMGFVQLLLLIVAVYATHFIGRAMGGTGTFEDALALVTWLQFIMVCLQVVQTGFLLVLPPVADLIALIGLALFLWLFTNFVAVLHGFRSLGLVFVMILLSAFGVTFVISLVLAMLGIAAPGGADA